MKKLLYISNQRLPTEKAYGIQIAKMCEAFGASGLEVKLLVPTRHNAIKTPFFEYYGIPETFKLRRISTPDFDWPGKFSRVAFHIKMFLSAVLLLIPSITEGADIVYSRDELPLILLGFFKKNVFFEAHKFSSRRSIYLRLMRRAGIKVVVISNGLKDEFVKFGFPPSRVLVAPDGVDIEMFSPRSSIEEARRRTTLPIEKRIVMYTGTLYRWKGADVIAGVLQYLREDELFVVVGGNDEDRRRIRDTVPGRDIEKVLFIEHVAHQNIPLFLAAADCLVWTGTPSNETARRYTSPLKLFEYMASGKPIIVSDLPSVREIVNADCAVLVQPDDPLALAKGIQKIFEDKQFANAIAQNAFHRVQTFSWLHRAKYILEYTT